MAENNKKLRRWSIIGVFVVFGLAAAWHFLYVWLPSGFTAAIAPVNESPWEHAKLFFIPAIIWYVILFFIEGKNYPNFQFAHGISLLVMPFFMLGLYYLYSSFIEETLAFDLINSLLTSALGAFVGYKLTTSERDFSKEKYKYIAVVIVVVLAAVFVLFTFRPPRLDPFLDDGQGKYGI